MVLSGTATFAKQLHQTTVVIAAMSIVALDLMMVPASRPRPGPLTLQWSNTECQGLKWLNRRHLRSNLLQRISRSSCRPCQSQSQEPRPFLRARRQPEGMTKLAQGTLPALPSTRGIALTGIHRRLKQQRTRLRLKLKASRLWAA